MPFTITPLFSFHAGKRRTMMGAASHQKVYWEHPGEVSYAEAMFADAEVAWHLTGRRWQILVDIGIRLGLDAQSHVLDLGCGDGSFANAMLAKHFRAVDGIDFSEAGIERAQAHSTGPNVRFEVRDITTMDFASLPKYDGVFLNGILHHVKDATPGILHHLREVTSRVIVLEPNGDHILRKLLELTAAYKAAGEDSFRTHRPEHLFHQVGYRKVVWMRLNLFPNFTPKLAFRLFRPLQPVVERTPVLRALCTDNMWGFAADEGA
jgi:2-polyprenyl-3-methyl-5-hydroxy-6-metoxy-1,4-benzoquinol methylase